MSTGNELPLKRVFIAAADYFRPGAGGSPPKVFGPITPDVRQQRADELRAVGAHFQKAFRTYPTAAAVARIVLKDEALAKVHRPTHILETSGCPIVGVGSFGELLVSVRRPTLADLERTILTSNTQVDQANISTIDRIEPFSIEAARREQLMDALATGTAPAVKLRLFRHSMTQTDHAIETAVLSQLQALGIQATRLDYARALTIYKLTGMRPEHVVPLADFVGTQSLGTFPQYHVVKPAAQYVGKLSPAQFPAPEKDMEYPIVGVVDTGVDPKNASLAPWIAGREVFVPAGDRDYEHGTFVAGLVVHSRALNHNDTRFPYCPCRILDVVAVPRSRTIEEDALVAVLQEVIKKHGNVAVWNLSLAGSERCSDHTFSDLAIALDELQTTHNVVFVLPTGNYPAAPYRDWPPSTSLGSDDRLCSPSDSARALTVGSVSHRDSPAARVRVDAPSPFSRRGPGPVYIPKPEVSHFGGNCDAQGQHAQIGVLSIDGNGNLVESIGTSFASPIVASIVAHVHARPRERLSGLMAKALVVHSAAVQADGLTASSLPYLGFGIPRDPAETLRCEPWRATLLFDIELYAGMDLQRVPFPIPQCLRGKSGAFRGEMTVTLVYEPPLDATYGAEYCRSNIDVSLGTYDLNANGKQSQSRQVHPFPRRNDATQEEKKLVEHGFKWSPVKVYRRVIPKGVTGDTWRLTLAATDRSGADNVPIRAAMVVTVADIDKRAPVYNDVVTSMHRLGWATADIQIRERMRYRG